MLSQPNTNPEAQATIQRSFAFHWPEFTVGSHVGVRYKKGTYGRIEAIVAMGGPDERSHLRSLYGVLKIRMEDGEIRLEHPEHLFSAKPPASEAA